MRVVYACPFETAIIVFFFEAVRASEYDIFSDGNELFDSFFFEKMKNPFKLRPV